MKALFCGLGSIGQRHVRNLRALLGDSVEIIAYRQRNASPVLNPDMTVRVGAELETTYNIRSYNQLEAALGEKPDIAFITNPNSLHLSTAMAAVEAGCHLFIEKPIADTLEGVETLISAVEARNRVAFVAYQFRFHPALQWIKGLMEQGRLGRITGGHVVNGEWLPGWHPYEDYRETHPARRELGGGCLRIQTHEFDYALWLFGMPTSVYAVGGHLSDLEVNVEDAVDILMACQHGGRPLPVHIRLDYVQRPPQRVCEVIGDQGKVQYDYYANQAQFFDLKSRLSEVFRFENFDRNQMFIEEMRHFLACVKGEEKSLVDLREGLRSMRIAHAADESLQTGEAVKLA